MYPKFEEHTEYRFATNPLYTEHVHIPELLSFHSLSEVPNLPFLKFLPDLYSHNNASSTIMTEHLSFMSTNLYHILLTKCTIGFCILEHSLHNLTSLTLAHFPTTLHHIVHCPKSSPTQQMQCITFSFCASISLVIVSLKVLDQGATSWHQAKLHIVNVYLFTD